MDICACIIRHIDMYNIDIFHVDIYIGTYLFFCSIVLEFV